ncbi:MAG: hypothetical protein LAO22_12640 [Acidobacteriia bacterium]|nr:hypothetical protein [Terriglobia bacterium]
MFRSVSMMILSLALCSWDKAVAQRKPQLTVIVYNDAGVPERVVKQAMGIAERIYRKVGIEIACREHDDSDAEGTAFFVRIVPNSFNLPREDFGVAFVGSDGLGVQADVFYSGIRQVAQSSSLDAAEILGHVIAHEVGHLLLGSNSHSALGIMQAHWAIGQLREVSMGTLGFDKQQSENIRARLLGPYAAVRVTGKTAGISSLTKASSPPM